MAIFLKGLHPVFQQLQVYFSIPGNMPTNFDAAVAIVRKFASSPVITMELAKLKTSGLSQAVFTMAAQEVKTTSTPQPSPIPNPIARSIVKRGLVGRNMDTGLLRLL